MPLEDVSNDFSTIDWLRHTGHGHLLDEQRQFSNIRSSSSPPTITGGYSNVISYNDSHRLSPSFPQTVNYNTQSYNRQPSPANFVSSPTQFLAPHMNQPQMDMDIENMKHDPNTRVIQRPSQGDVVYKQRIFVRYLQPPTPPVSGAIIVREKQPPPPPPEPPIVIKRAPPPPPTPPPVIIRERPPPIPPPEGTTVINKFVPAPPPPPRQVIIEQYPSLPPKPQNVIIERWLPVPPRQRRIFYERLPAPTVTQQRPLIVQHGQPCVRIQRQVTTAPMVQCPHQQASIHTDINQILCQIAANQQTCSTINMPSSLASYNPCSTLQPSYGCISHPQSNIIITQNEQPNIISPPSYGVPLSCVCHPSTNTGLGAYGSGISTIPTMGYSPGQSTVYNVPGNVPIDNILRQLGVDPYSVQPPTDPHTAVSHVWNAASHANPPNQLNPTSAVSHVWNAAAHATDPNRAGSPAVKHVWDHIEHYLHPQTGHTGQPYWH